MPHQNKFIAGVVLLGIAIAIIVSVARSGDNDGKSPQGDLACTLGASGVGLIAAGLSRGESATVIIATVGGPAVAGFACKQMVDTLVEKPEEPVALNIRNGDGSTADTSPTGGQLASPAPTLPSPGPNLIDCLRWQSQFLFNLCLEGTIGPP